MPNFNPTFNYCIGNIKSATVRGTLSLAVWVDRINRPKNKTVDLVRRIRTEPNETHRANLKNQLPSVTPAVHFFIGDRRRYENIRSFTGIMMLDFDKIKYAAEMRDYLFHEYPYIIASWLSSSGKGCRAVVRVPVCKTTDDFKLRFKALSNIMNQYEGFDRAPQNAVLPLYYSIDAEIKHDLDREYVFNEIAPPEPIIERRAVDWRMPSERHKKWAVENTIKSIDKINDNGHPQLRGASFALGGYVGAGYIGEQEAVGLMDQLIETNNYLSKKHRVYKETARTMIKQGQSKPLTI